MPANEFKLEHSLTDAELPAYLRRLADWLESGCADDGNACDLGVNAADFLSFKLGLKRRAGAIALSLKIKGGQPPQHSAASAVHDASATSAKSAVPASPERPRKAATGEQAHSSLKKRLGQSFKAIQTALKQGELPAKEPLAAFLADSRRMTSVPGKGDEHYPEYDTACAALEQATQRGDTAAAAQAVNTLAACKRRCHSKYK